MSKTLRYLVKGFLCCSKISLDTIASVYISYSANPFRRPQTIHWKPGGGSLLHLTQVTPSGWHRLHGSTVNTWAKMASSSTVTSSRRMFSRLVRIERAIGRPSSSVRSVTS